MCDTIRGIRGLGRRHAAAVERLAGRRRCLDCQSGDRLWCARLSDRAQYVPMGFCDWGGGAYCYRCVGLGVTAPADDRPPCRIGSYSACGLVAYEVVLSALTPVLGGAGAFTITIVARIGVLNVLWMIGLVLAYELLRLFVLKRQQFVS
jgi:hypothetical protein